MHRMIKKCLGCSLAIECDRSWRERTEFFSKALNVKMFSSKVCVTARMMLDKICQTDSIFGQSNELLRAKIWWYEADLLQNDPKLISSTSIIMSYSCRPIADRSAAKNNF